MLPAAQQDEQQDAHASKMQAACTWYVPRHTCMYPTYGIVPADLPLQLPALSCRYEHEKGPADSPRSRGRSGRLIYHSSPHPP